MRIFAASDKHLDDLDLLLFGNGERVDPPLGIEAEAKLVRLPSDGGADLFHARAIVWPAIGQ